MYLIYRNSYKEIYLLLKNLDYFVSKLLLVIVKVIQSKQHEVSRSFVHEAELQIIEEKKKKKKGKNISEHRFQRAINIDIHSNYLPRRGELIN